MPGSHLFAKHGRTYQAGEILFRENEPGDTMFVIHSGQVRLLQVSRDRYKTLAVLGPGEFFGEMAILNARPRTATAQALTELQVLVMDSQRFGQMLRDSVEIGVRIMTKLADRLDAANSLNEVLLRRDPRARVIMGLERAAAIHGVALEDGGVMIPVTGHDLATELGVTEDELEHVMVRLRRLRIAHEHEDAFVVSDVGRLGEFLTYLEQREPLPES